MKKNHTKMGATSTVTFIDFILVGTTPEGKAIYQEVEHEDFWDSEFPAYWSEWEPIPEPYPHDVFLPDEHLPFDPMNIGDCS